jgi:hypothetical protein
MSSCRKNVEALAPVGLLAIAIVLLGPVGISAAEFEASTAPDGQYLLKVFPNFFYTSAYFSSEGRALSLGEVTGLLYFELPIQLQYGITESFSVGVYLPIGWAYQEKEARPESVDRIAVRELWFTVQHRWLTLPFISSFSVRLKMPLASKKPWEDGLHMGDGQVDIYPLYYFDYFSETMYWYVQMAAGYKYRFEASDYKPFDEITFYLEGGYELFPDLRMRFYLYADLKSFGNGDFLGEDLKFFEKEGYLHEFGYGISLWPRPTFRLEITTGGDWSGANQYRGMRWMLGFTKIF